MPDDTLIAALLFVGAYVLIAVERWDRTLIALLTAMVMVLLGIVDQHEAFAAIDLNVIFLLVGMMIIASILARTGFFEWLAIRSVVLSDGHPIRLLLILSLVTAVVSAFLDNVTTVVLMTPVTLSVARRLGISPVPYLIAQILASNIGGTATLIGDPPNILIGSAAGLGFGAFLWNLAPVVILIFIAFAGIMALTYPQRPQGAGRATPGGRGGHEGPRDHRQRAARQGPGRDRPDDRRLPGSTAHWGSRWPRWRCWAPRS